MPLTDEQIKTDIVNSLSRDIRVDASDILVEVNGKVVKLMGTVPAYRARRTASELAMDTRGVLSVDNQIAIAYPSTVPLPSDEAIQTNAKNILAWSTDIDDGKAQVRVNTGVVTLSGSVSAYWQRDKAEDLVADLHGVSLVINELSVVPTEKVADEMIAENIVDDLGRSNLVDTSNVAVKVANGVVTLTGTVETYAAKRRAYGGAATMPGVVNVINDIFTIMPSKQPLTAKELTMNEHIYKRVELVGSSSVSIEQAVQNAVQKASQTIRNLRWFEVVETRGDIENGKVAHWQVAIKIGFTVDDPAQDHQEQLTKKIVTTPEILSGEATAAQIQDALEVREQRQEQESK